MLRELYIENLALIDRARLVLEPGLNALTGETGAGKSLVIDALELVLGGRASPDLVKAGEDGLLVEAFFQLSGPSPVRERLAEMGWEADEVVLTREAHRSGRSLCRLNGRPVTVGMLRSLTRGLVDLHGQHEHQLLLDKSTHLRFLDAFAGQEQLRRQVEEAFGRWREIRSQLAGFSAQARERVRRLDLLEFQIREIDAARLRTGEEEELARERLLLAGAEQLAAAVRGAYESLYGGSDGAAHDRLAQALACLEDAVRLDSRLEPLRDQLREALATVDEVAREVAVYADGIQFDPGRLAEVEERLQLIASLKKKYADTVSGILLFRQEAARERELLLGAEESAEFLEREQARWQGRLVELAGQLSGERQRAASRLQERVEEELKELGMGSARFLVEVRQREEEGGLPCGSRRLAVGPAGADEVEFLFSANPGESPRPLERVASGGELSRVMLALKTVLAEADAVPTVVFDEVDAGVGGRTAAILGAKLARVARQRQVVVVTHLAPVASFAQHHLLVNKITEKGKTDVQVIPLVEEEERVKELARMLGGAALSKESLEHARRLRQEALALST